jgi:hypothetical protein
MPSEVRIMEVRIMGVPYGPSGMGKSIMTVDGKPVPVWVHVVYGPSGKGKSNMWVIQNDGNGQ